MGALPLLSHVIYKSIKNYRQQRKPARLSKVDEGEVVASIVHSDSVEESQQYISRSSSGEEFGETSPPSIKKNGDDKELLATVVGAPGDVSEVNDGQVADTDQKEDNNSSGELIEAAGQGDLGGVKQALENDANINAVDSNELTALHYAAWKGHYGITKLLLEAPDIYANKVDNKGWTALNLAILNGNTKIVELLLAEPRIDPNKANHKGLRAIHLAVREGHMEILKLLLADSRVALNEADRNGVTALQHAALKGDKETVELLLENPRIDPNVADYDGFTALHSATYCKNSSEGEAVARVLQEFRT